MATIPLDAVSPPQPRVDEGIWNPTIGTYKVPCGGTYVLCCFLNNVFSRSFRTSSLCPSAWKLWENKIEGSTMMKFATLAALVASASAFAPSQQSARSSVALNAERSKSLPFMNRPALVSRSVDGFSGESLEERKNWFLQPFVLL